MGTHHRSQKDDWLKTRIRRFWLPLLLGVVATIAVLGLWQQLVVEEHQHIEQLVQQQVDLIQVELEKDLTAHISALERMAKRWDVAGGTSKNVWEAAATSNLEDFPGLQAIVWVNSSFQVQWVVPQSKSDLFLNLNLSQVSDLRSTLDEAQKRRQSRLTPSLLFPNGEKDLLAVTPLFLETPADGTGHDRFDGFILGLLPSQTLFGSILPPVSQYHIEIVDDAEFIYQQGEILPSTSSKKVTLPAYGREWQVQVALTSLIHQERSFLPNVVLWGGLAGAWTLALVVYLGQQARRQSCKTRIMNQQLRDEIRHRQQIEVSLRQSEERWHLALRGNNDGVWDWNVKTNQVFFSSRWQEMLGLEEGEISNRLEEWSRRVHPDDLGNVTEAISNHFSKETPFYISEHRVRCKNGSYKWVLDRGQAVWDEAGNVVRMVGSHTDITERKQSELALQESEARYQRLVSHINAGFVVHAPDTHILQCNPAACELLGLSMDQMLGRAAIDPAWHFVREDGTAMPVEEFPVNLVLSAQSPLNSYVLGINREDQSRVWVLVTAFPELDADQQIQQVVVTFIDISQLKQVERNLREMTTAMENAISGISKLDTQGCYLYVNKIYADITGYQPEAMLGMDWQRTVHPEDLEVARDAYRRMLQDGKVEIEAKGIRQDGSVFYKQLVMIATYNEQQQFVGHYCFVKDISDRKQAEEQLQNLSDRLNLAVQSAKIGIWEWDVVHNHLVWDDRMYELYGIPPSDFDETYKAWVRGLHPEDVAASNLAIQQALAGEKKFEPEFRVVCPDGTIRHIEAHALVQRAPDGQPLRMIGVNTDITEHKQAEAALRQSEATKQAIIQAIPDLLIRMHADGNYVAFISNSHFNIINPAQVRQDATVYDVLPAPLAQLRMHYTQLALASDTTQIYEQEIAIEGGQCYEEVRIVPLLQDEVLVMVRDITDRKQSEIALQLSQEQLQLALEASGDGLWDWNIVTGEVYYSPQYMTMLEYGENELPQNFETWKYLTHPDDQPWVLDILDANLRGSLQHYSFDYRLRAKSGDWKWIADYGKVVARDAQGNPLRMIGTHRDISDRKQAETELKQQKEMLQAIVDHIPVMIALFDRHGRIEFVNLELEHILGWSLAEWQHQDVLALCYPDAAYRQSVTEFMLAATGRWQDMKTLTATGQSLETSWANVKLSNGQFLGIGQDISDRKRKEFALQQAMEAAEAANLAKSMFLANMSHELRTPLNVILGFAQVMAHDVSLTPSQHKDLQTIKRSGDYLLSLINDVLDLSKIEAGHTSLEESGFDLIALLHMLRTMMAERAQVKQLQLMFEIAPEVPQFVVADEQKLRQILLNLLSNAIKFTNQGNVMLRVSVSDARSSEENRSENQLLPLRVCPPISQSSHPINLQFEVIDTGVGIAKDERETIFDAFVQAEAGRKSVSGTGLGLTISRKLIELMHGTIAVQTVLNEGSTFTVDIPVCSTSGNHVQAKQSDRTIIGLVPGQSHHRILIVDDQRENRLLMVRLLTQLGLEVREAVNGQEAVQLWQEWQPDLTWMDIRMPVLDGYEATKQIRAMEQEQSSTIIALTAQASQSDRALALASGCNDYISKPFREETLFLKLQEYLGLEYLYTDSDIPPSSASMSSHMNTNNMPAFDASLLAQLPNDWLATLEDLALCCNDREIVDLANQLAPELDSFRMQLLDLVNRFEFEQIIHLIHRDSPS